MSQVTIVSMYGFCDCSIDDVLGICSSQVTGIIQLAILLCYPTATQGGVSVVV